MKESRASIFCALSVACIASVILAACGPTYPKEKIKESVIKVCKDEYNIDVKVETIGKTVAIYLPLEDLIDFTFAISKTASDKINDVILSVSRVTLSTDASYDFYCIIAHDVKIPEIQIVIIKSVDDVKRFLLNDISRGEYSKRMLIDIRLSPQARKERAIKEVFNKMSLDKKWQEQVLNDFFRSEPTALGDIGYWNNRFYIKDISLPEFLAEQIASRIKLDFKEDKHLSEAYLVRSTKGSYLTSKEGKHFFKFEIFIDQKGMTETEGNAASEEIMGKVVSTIAYVLHYYNFSDFEYADVINQAGGVVYDISKEKLESFRNKKIRVLDLMQ